MMKIFIAGQTEGGDLVDDPRYAATDLSARK